MLSPIELSVAGTAALGSVTMLWGNIRGIFARLESIIIVKATIHGNAESDVLDYCWANYKSSPLAMRRFWSENVFIKPKNRIGRIAMEHPGSFTTFWSGWRPLFFSTTKNSELTGSTLSFIRGTFDLEKLLIDSVDYHDNKKRGVTKNGSRYYVRRCFGSRSDRADRSNNNAHPSSIASDSPEKEESGGYISGKRPLLYTKEDLGMPTSNSPMENLAYDSSVTEFYEECSRWKNSEDWFKKKGLPWRFGAGLFGPAGTGKSSLARALGQGLDMPIHSYDLTTMDNQELCEAWKNSLCCSPCIVLLEDIDRIFDEKKQIKTANDKAPLTLDCLLNCISGVQPSDGILVLVTANDVTKLDPALGVPDSTGKSTRPGRLDRALYVGILNEEGRYKIAKRILSDVPHLIEEEVKRGDGETGAQFESRCGKLALEQYWGKFKVYGDSNAKLLSPVITDGVETIDSIRRGDSYA